MKPSDALINLDAYIENEISSLKKYAEKPDASPEYIRRKNIDISRLCEAYNCLAKTKYIDVWQKLEIAFADLENRDPQLNGHCVVLRKSEAGDNFSFTKINLY